MITSHCNITHRIRRSTNKDVFLAYQDLASAALASGNMQDFYTYDQHREHYWREMNAVQSTKMDTGEGRNIKENVGRRKTRFDHSHNSGSITGNDITQGKQDQSEAYKEGKEIYRHERKRTKGRNPHKGHYTPDGS